MLILVTLSLSKGIFVKSASTSSAGHFDLYSEDYSDFAYCYPEGAPSELPIAYFFHLP